MDNPLPTKHRPNLDQFFMAMLDTWATRSTCVRRQVAAIVTDVKGKILSAGYNGVPSGVPHCIINNCEGAKDPAGDSRRCMAIHAEQNAMLQCHRLDLAHTMYVHCTPCLTCAKLICNTNIKRVVFFEMYADPLGLALLSGRGITMLHVKRYGLETK